MKKLFGILLALLFLTLPLIGDWYWNKYTGKLDYYEKSTAGPWWSTLYLYDLDMSNKLAISWPENDVLDRTLRFYVNGGARIINLAGDFTLSGTNQVGLWTVTNILTANSTILQAASQYHNWGGLAGAGGYGFRDNAGIMEYKNSGGAWAAIGVGGGAHNFLSATHPDTVVASPILGDILYGNVTPAWTKLAGNTTANKKYLSQTGTGAVSTVPSWEMIPIQDIAATNITASLIWDDGWHDFDFTATTSSSARWVILSIYCYRNGAWCEDMMFGPTGTVADANCTIDLWGQQDTGSKFGGVIWLPLDVNQVAALHCPNNLNAKFVRILGYQ